MQMIYLPGILILLVALIFNYPYLIYFSGILILMAAILYCLNMAKIIIHIFKPDKNEIRNNFI
jgi:hypothetical protein